MTDDPRRQIEQAFSWWLGNLACPPDEWLPRFPPRALEMLRERLMCEFGDEHVSDIRRSYGVVDYIRCSRCGRDLPTVFVCNACDPEFRTEKREEMSKHVLKVHDGKWDDWGRMAL